MQLVSGFDHGRGGALDASGIEKTVAAPLVIPALANRDWRREAEIRSGGRQKKAIYIPEEAKRRELRAEDLRDVDNTGAGETYGLQTFEKKEEEGEGEGVEVGEPGEEKKEMTEDERAIAALMGAEKAESDLVIARAADTVNWREAKPEGNEDDAYRKDVSSRPNIPTLDDYAAVPVEDFGAAMLRGMGWKGGDELGGKGKGAGGKSGKLRLVEKRPAFLGIGAKPVTDIPELGAWGKGDKKKRGRPDTTYIPVVKIDKRTGKPVEENQVAKAGRSGDRDGDSKKAEGDSDRRRVRDRSSERSGRDKDGHRESGRGQDRNREGARGEDRHRDSGRDSGRHRDSGRDQNERRDSGRDQDRHRDSGRSKDRPRESGRDREREGDRDRRRERDGRDRRRSHDRDYEKRERR